MDLDMGDPETRLLAISTVGWVLVGILAAILVRKKKKKIGYWYDLQIQSQIKYRWLQTG